MRVVATHKGHYGGRIREPGEVFAITDKKHFSKRWMAKEGSREAKEYLNRNKPTEPDHAAERVAAGGTTEALAVMQEELDRANQRIETLQAKLARYEGSAEAEKEPGPAEPETPAEPDPVPSPSEAQERAAEDAGAQSAQPRRRRTRSGN